MKTWFIVHWDIKGSHIDGPFGDDEEGARESARKGLKDGTYEAAAITQLDIEEISVEEAEKAA